MSNKIIVQCPACTTKFSIGPEQVEGIDEPRFHCSRCGHYFTHKFEADNAAAVAAPIVQTSEVEKPLLAAAQSVRAESTDPDDRSRKETTLMGSREFLGIRDKATKETSAEQMSLLPNSSTDSETAADGGNTLDSRSMGNQEELPVYTAEWPDSPSELTSSPFAEAEAEIPTPPPVAHWPETGVTQTTNATSPMAEMAAVKSEPVQPPEKEITRATQHTEIYQRPSKSLFGMPTKGASERTPSESLANFGSEAPKSKDAPSSAKRKYSVGQSLGGAVSSVKSAISNAKSSVKIKPSLTLDAMSKVKPDKVPSSVSRARDFISPVALVCSLPMLMASGFFVWGGNLNHTPAAVSSLFHLQTGHLPRVAPPGLELVGVQSESITLESGEKIIEINGMLFNSTVEPFDEVKIEAKLYSEDNTPVQTLVVDAANALQSASQLSALRVDALEKLQSRAALGMMPLKSHEHVPFRMVFTAPAKEARWFSARVYSVRPGSDS